MKNDYFFKENTIDYSENTIKSWVVTMSMLISVCFVSDIPQSFWLKILAFGLSFFCAASDLVCHQLYILWGKLTGR